MDQVLRKVKFLDVHEHPILDINRMPIELDVDIGNAIFLDDVKHSIINIMTSNVILRRYSHDFELTYTNGNEVMSGHIVFEQSKKDPNQFAVFAVKLKKNTFLADVKFVEPAVAPHPAIQYDTDEKVELLYVTLQELRDNIERILVEYRKIDKKETGQLIIDTINYSHGAEITDENLQLLQTNFIEGIGIAPEIVVRLKKGTSASNTSPIPMDSPPRKGGKSRKRRRKTSMKKRRTGRVKYV